MKPIPELANEEVLNLLLDDCLNSPFENLSIREFISDANVLLDKIIELKLLSDDGKKFSITPYGDKFLSDLDLSNPALSKNLREFVLGCLAFNDFKS